ncbi:UNVERIFIED_CONTAM: Transcription initiation factor TFIID subunit [Sesamum radiatum]|uniref:Transcription initiation factor TFIID subunit n=1 Tax=Sesamum radiatum TaxID=300843 RepID=A0AAW2RW76_SESRA
MVYCNYCSADDEADRKKKKKTRAAVEQVGVAYKSKSVPENTDGIKKTNTASKRIVQPEGSFVSMEKITKDQKEVLACLTFNFWVQVESLSAKKPLLGKLKVKKKNEIEQMGLLNKKVKILADGMNLGHMRTNKNCPKYREDTETRAESTDLEKSSSKPNFVDLAEQSQQKPLTKKVTPKNGIKTAGSEAPEDDKPTSKAKVLKVKCGATDKLPDRHTPPTSQSSDRPVISDAETGQKSVVKVNKIIFSNKTKPEDMLVETPKPSIVIKPPVDADRDQPRKKIIIKQPKEIINLDDNSQDGSLGLDYRKTKKMIELSSLDKHREHDNKNFFEESSRMRDPEGNPWWVEDKRRNAERQQEERNRRAEKMRMIDEQPAYELLRYEEAIRREREEEERQRAKAKKKKKRKPEIKDDYLDDLPPRRNDRRLQERDKMVRRRPEPEYGKHAPDYAQASKRRRGGEVGLSNILENIVETLRGRKEISYLFLKPVTKKEAPDYLDIVSHPMDLSTIRDKARRMEYKSRDDFRHDVYQIVFNAHKYNDRRNPGIPPLADQLLELCDFLLDQYDAELTEAEAGIE